MSCEDLRKVGDRNLDFRPTVSQKYLSDVSKRKARKVRKPINGSVNKTEKGENDKTSGSYRR